ncbi:hypothetical protein A4A49_07956 [Nicotiana attenuata]|uniref:Glyoxalase/fosfomycin resistance/dioxygenase domain-containing protein n=1 Tax=Nicotiana attenuata TaxID=49451 RepID=A0A1J6IK85_NICAT|nr:hypothetical protein A4A49_07956 [Nicotiana attenuata]
MQNRPKIQSTGSTATAAEPRWKAATELQGFREGVWPRFYRDRGRTAAGAETSGTKRPSSFDFDGAWLFNHGIGVHLLGKEDAPSKNGKIINPKDNHISFQCSDMDLIIRRLDEMKVEYVIATVKEGGVTVDQLFFHDPDGNMIEICNCQNIPILPLSSCPLKKFNKYPVFNQTMPNSFHGNGTSKMNCLGEVEYLMMENLAMNMIDILF